MSRRTPSLFLDRHRTVDLLSHAISCVGGFHDMSTESCFCCNENQKINESPGWNGFDWVIEWFLWWEKPPRLKKIDRRSCLVAFEYNHMLMGSGLTD
jgi:hypothetical protein